MVSKKGKENKTGSISNNRGIANTGSGNIRQDNHKVDTGGGAYVGGSVSVSGGDFVGRDKITTGGGADTAVILEAFAQLIEKIESMPAGPDKIIAEQAVGALKEEALKPEPEVQESKVQKWFNFLAQTAPDAFDVAIETFKNPIKGISSVFQKIAQRAREEKAKN